MSKDTSGPAFPTTAMHEREQGMTLRQYAAIKAMQGLLANGEALAYLSAHAKDKCSSFRDVVSKAAVDYADSLLAELEK